MSSPRRQRQRASRARNKLLLRLLIAFPVLLVAAYFVGRAWVENYLRSDAFRRFVSQKTAETLHAEGEFEPLHFTGLSVYSDGFKARGSEKAAFSSLALDQVRAELSLRRLRERVWQIDHIDVQRLEVGINGSRITLPEPDVLAAPTPSRGSGSGWLPNRVEIATADFRTVDASWGQQPAQAGSLRGLALAAEMQNGAWMLNGSGGRVEQAGYPGLELKSLRARYLAPTLIIQGAELRQGATGVITAEGDVNFEEKADMRLKLAGVDVTPLLSPDWRMRLHGQLGGEVRVQSPLPATAPPTITGTVRLSQGQLEALPILDQIALFTQLQQYRRLSLSNASASFRQEAGKLTVTNMVIESEGLIRLEGGFTIANGQIAGDFQVGVTSASLQWIPGSQERIFTVARNGYLWTPMHVAGPVNSPGEDLSPRLAAAIPGALIEKGGTIIQGATDTTKDVIKGSLDYLMPLFKK